MKLPFWSNLTSQNCNSLLQHIAYIKMQGDTLSWEIFVHHSDNGAPNALDLKATFLDHDLAVIFHRSLRSRSVHASVDNAVEPRCKVPRYNEIPGATNVVLQPSQSYS